VEVPSFGFSSAKHIVGEGRRSGGCLPPKLPRDR
jgi:hypothetical protein